MHYANGDLGTCFTKKMYGEEDYFNQEGRYHRLRDAGISVPSEFGGHVLPDENIWLVASDLTNNGEKLVISPNNQEIRSYRHAENCRRLSQESKRRIAETLFDFAEKAAKIGLELDSNAYGLVLDPESYEGGEPYVIDFGHDVRSGHHRSYEDLVGRNIYSAGDFVAMVLGCVPEQSEHPRYERYLEKYSSSWREDADYFWEKSDKDSLQGIRLETNDKVTKAVRKIIDGGRQLKTDNKRRKVDVMQMRGLAHVKMAEGGQGRYLVQGLRYIKTDPLGACIALVLYNQKESFGMLEHVAITNDIERCLEELFQRIETEGLDVKDFKAKVFGGSERRAEEGQGFQENIKHMLVTIDKALSQKQIPITEADVEGEGLNRCIIFDLADGSVNDYVYTLESIKKEDIKIESYTLPVKRLIRAV